MSGIRDPAGFRARALGTWATTRPRRFDATCLRVTLPRRQCAAVSSFRAVASFLPTSFGTTPLRGVGTGPAGEVPPGPLVVDPPDEVETGAVTVTAFVT